MFRATGLPNTEFNNVIRAYVPCFRLWQGTKRGMGAIALVNRVGIGSEAMDISYRNAPIWIADYYRGEFINPLRLLQVNDLNSNYALSGDFPNLDTYWFNEVERSIHVISYDTDLTITASVAAINSASISTQLTVAQVNYQGQSQPFSQAGTNLSVNLPEGVEIEITGTLKNLTRRAKILAFEIDLAVLDVVTWQGKNYNPANNNLNPQVGEFLFDGKGQALLFTDLFATPNKLSAPPEGISRVGGINF